MRGTFRALQSRNYRLFFVGQTLSLIGTWMQSVAMGWLVYRITGSELLLGTVTFAQQIPMFVVSPFAGVAAERVDRRRLLILTQSLQAMQAVVLAMLVFAHRETVGELVALSIFMGVVNAFDVPGRQAFVIQMVSDREHLANAIALNSTQFNIARLIGPAIAGFTIKFTGEGVCFLINAVSFLAVIIGLTMIRVDHKPAPTEGRNMLVDLQEGARYVARHPPIRSLLILLAVASFVSGSYQVLLPVYAKTVYHGDATTLGFMYAAVGMGALVAAIMLASRRSVVGLGRWIVAASAIFSVALALFGLTTSMVPGILVLTLVGFGAMKHMGSTNTMIQTLVDDRMRGRVMAFYAMSFVGTMPIGSLITGALSPRIGPQLTMLGAGVIGLAASIWFMRKLPGLREHIRPVYEKQGILKAT